MCYICIHSNTDRTHIGRYTMKSKLGYFLWSSRLNIRDNINTTLFLWIERWPIIDIIWLVYHPRVSRLDQKFGIFDIYIGLVGQQNGWVWSRGLLYFAWTQKLWCDASMALWIQALSDSLHVSFDSSRNGVAKRLKDVRPMADVQTPIKENRRPFLIGYSAWQRVIN